ncbi:FtsP/CotA-like multicopper oxidase with cupredoxin domain [Paenibacillus phyllosphaerae]|uniref:FtsP/CotA-like multicopper oxidase with cupredoxin domain n=1 Tax=Paenibacillus phyllosphaerae TaxID=274593 RepID=A0A7W5FR68_9BACL|nr:multicopper oxidase family protein [Paenibacillus phyllosphaerae]MBB3114028.1 FtsP/CotA-like multicopper oxidase with cupredoxin domain [Paenibacillus phyllosphaerae]
MTWKGKAGIAGLALTILLGTVIGTYFWQMRLQKPFDVNMAAMHHTGGMNGHEHGTVHGATSTGLQPSLSCEAIIAKAGEEPVHEIQLTAAQQVTKLDNGQIEEVWAFNSLTPGPEIRVTEGERVRVVLKNTDIQEGVTVHWHGIVLPCSQDGVAGVTQEAVKPGEQFTYEFIADHPGTYWYHSHQASSVQVEKGLLGKLIIEPLTNRFEYDQEETVLIQELNGTMLMNGSTQGVDIQASPGQTLRLRMINAANETEMIRVNGATFRIIAMDGHDLHEPEMLEHHQFQVAAGQRYDLLLQMPRQGKVIVESESGLKAALGSGNDPEPRSDYTLFSWTDYGTPDPLAPVENLTFDQSHTLELGQNLFVKSINGKSFHEIPPIVVKEGQRVKLTIINEGGGDHPFHLHGHIFQVLSRNGQPLSGSPVFLDTLATQEGETYEVYVKADNPGLWMMHCHNLMHASMGMSMMFNYEGVSTPYRVGTKTGNLPDL